MVLGDRVVTGTLDDISVQSLEPQLASSSHHEGSFESSTKLEIARLTRWASNYQAPSPTPKKCRKYSPTKGTTLVVRDAGRASRTVMEGRAAWRSRLLFTRGKKRILAENFAIFTFLGTACPKLPYPRTLIWGVENESYFPQQKAQISEINCKLRDWAPQGQKASPHISLGQLQHVPRPTPGHHNN